MTIEQHALKLSKEMIRSYYRHHVGLDRLWPRNYLVTKINCNSQQKWTAEIVTQTDDTVLFIHRLTYDDHHQAQLQMGTYQLVDVSRAKFDDDFQLSDVLDSKKVW